MKQGELNEILRKHQAWRNNTQDGKRADLQGANLCEANLRGADLYRANLYGANLQGANLCEANLDFSCWPLWCGTRNVRVDKRLAVQLAAHLCALDCDDPEYQAVRQLILPFARQFRRIMEFPLP